MGHLARALVEHIAGNERQVRVGACQGSAHARVTRSFLLAAEALTSSSSGDGRPERNAHAIRTGLGMDYVVPRSGNRGDFSARRTSVLPIVMRRFSKQCAGWEGSPMLRVSIWPPRSKRSSKKLWRSRKVRIATGCLRYAGGKSRVSLGKLARGPGSWGSFANLGEDARRRRPIASRESPAPLIATFAD